MMKFLIVTGLLFFAAGFTPAEEGKHLFILSGQSNMAGLRPEESFIPTVEKKYGKEHVIVVKNAKGGQPIRRWDKSWQATGSQNTKQIGDLYDELMKAVKPQIEGQNLSSVTFVWMQGERDAREGNADLYEASFQRLLEQLKADLGIKELNFVIGRLSDFDMENKAYPHWTKMREVLISIAEKSEDGEWVDTDDLNDGKNRRGKEIKNDLHYSADGYVTFGTRLAEKAIGLIEK
ncbi:MAG: sialate O-acetylesterase [Verrucomicrobiales bacterium]|nr:sialate O-acetylesterase [Verrucomicrobiales bacterium]